MVVGRSQDTISLLDAISRHTTYVKNGSSSCLYDIHHEIGTTTHPHNLLLYQNIKKTCPFDWFTNRNIYDSRSLIDYGYLKFLYNTQPKWLGTGCTLTREVSQLCFTLTHLVRGAEGVLLSLLWLRINTPF